MIYNTIIRPVWSYGLQIWGPAKPSNTRPVQAHQNIALRLITNAPWYINNVFPLQRPQHYNRQKTNYRNHVSRKIPFQTRIPHKIPHKKLVLLHPNRENPERRLKKNSSRDLL